MDEDDRCARSPFFKRFNPREAAGREAKRGYTIKHRVFDGPKRDGNYASESLARKLMRRGVGRSSNWTT